MCLGVAIKSLTGSRRVIDILNRLGHSVCYQLVVEYETELANAIQDKGQLLPDGLIPASDLCTAVAYDNYDEICETLSGAGTLHDTVGICYQNSISQAQTTVTDKDISNIHQGISRLGLTRKSFVYKERNLEPYRKKPKISQYCYDVKSVPRPQELTLFEYRDYLWMMSMESRPTPMWTGWNSLITEDALPKQKVLYLENLTLPPTRNDVVLETMKMSQQIAKECGEDYMLVHYDLAIAKPALQIQAAESPRFDNLFIAFGPFHISLAFFRALGYLIDSSGGPEMLTESGLLATGSLNGFLSGNHYNRCKRLHPMLATALQILHFRFFLSLNGPISEELYRDLFKEKTPEAMKELEASPAYISFMQKYSEFADITLSGGHGATARFWMVYIKIVNLHLMFMRACKTNNLRLFTFILGQMRYLFFTCSRHNYARWMHRYYLNLANIDTSHPGLRNVLENGAFTVKRTGNSFSRTPADLTLEQTVNADQASRLTGITSFTTLATCRRRWLITRSARSAIIGALLVKAGLIASDDGLKDLKAYRIRKDNENMNELLDTITAHMNPFQMKTDDNLYCLSSGKSVPAEVKEDLLNCIERGKSWCEEFEKGCQLDPLRFEKPIPRRKVQNFASVSTKTSVKNNKKVVELKVTRDLFGRLVYLSITNNLDIKKVFEFPLTSVPLSLAHVDGSLNKTDKSKLIQRIERDVVSTDPVDPIDITLVDGMFLLHSLQNLPGTFGEIASLILLILCRLSTRVDMICDVYRTPSIKDLEHCVRSADDAAYSITGRDQRRPKEWQKALRSANFKTAFLKFLAQDWTENADKSTLAGHHIYLAVDEACHHYTVHQGSVFHEEVADLACSHEEADTRIVFHLSRLQLNNNPSIVVRCSDTDIFILLLFHISQLSHKPLVWMEVGLSSNNTRRFINVSQLVNHMGKEVVAALPGFHAYTGTDFTASFMGKGKMRPFDIMIKNEKFTNAFACLGRSDKVDDSIISDIEKFTCCIYSMPKLSSVNDVRMAVFERKYAPSKTASQPLDKIKGTNPSDMPPCLSSIVNKVKRANFIAYMWKNASVSNPSDLDPIDHGWLLKDNQYVINWYDGEQLPQSIANIICNEDNGELNNSMDEEDEEEVSLCSSDESDDDPDL